MRCTLAYRILLTERVSVFAEQLAQHAQQQGLCVQGLRMETSADAQALLNTYLQQYRPHVVISTLQPDEDTAFLAPLLAYCQQANTAVIHLSSGEVFSPRVGGQGYLETQTPNGHSERARQWQALEQQVQAVARHCVLRLPPVLCENPGGWVDKLCRALRHVPVLKVSSQHRLDPVHLADVSRVVVAMVQQILCGAENWGALHLRSQDACVEAEFVDYIARLFQKSHQPSAQQEISPLLSPWLPQYGLLAGEHLTQQFGIQLRSWRLGLKSLVQHWVEDQRQGELF